MFDWLFGRNIEVQEPVRDYRSKGIEYLATRQFRYFELKADYHTQVELERHFNSPVFSRKSGFTVIKGTQKKEFPIGLVFDTHRHCAITYDQLGRQEWK